jgi:hypothetical protein
MVNLTARARRFNSPVDLPSLRHVWDFETDELSSIGFRTLQQLAASDFARTTNRIATISQTLLEFADLQDMIVPHGGGRFYNINFFYFEGMSALREATLAGLNGCLHASLAVLRAAFEMLILDCWWRLKRREEQSYASFYGWFDGSSTAPGVGRVLPDCYARRPTAAPTEAEARELYRRLCSYVHKPTFHEAITKLRGSAHTRDTQDALHPWTNTVESTLRIVLDLAVRCSPQCLFPIETTRKFGFSPPVGLFFDANNTVPLTAALGESVLQQYRDFFGKDGVPSQVRWARDHPDLTDDQIIATWSDDDPLPEGKTPAETIRLGEMFVKAKTRGLCHILAYDAKAPTLPDFTKIFEEVGLDG